MATKNQIIAAIDIGTTKVVAVAGVKDEFGKINILGSGQAESRGVVRGSVQNVSEVSAAINTAVTKCKAAAGCDFRNVFVGIAGQNVRTEINTHSKFIDSGIIKQADIDQLTSEVYTISKEAGEEIIHVIPQGYIVDGSNIVGSAAGCPGRKLEGRFFVAVGKANSITAIRQAVNMAGLNIVKIILEPIASSEAILTEDEKEAGVLVADIGGGTTDIAVYQKKVLKTTSYVPFGGNAVTADIKNACHIIERQAETLKIKYGSALNLSEYSKKIAVVNAFGSAKEISFADLANIINARLDEILGGIACLIEKDGLRDSLTAGIVITGGGAKLNNIIRLIKFRLGMDVRLGQVRNVEVNSCGLNDSEYTASVGLLIKGFEYLETYLAGQSRAAQETQKNGAEVKEEQTKPAAGGASKEKKKGGWFSRLKKFASEFLEDPEENA
ncbi:MAG: cell division protein FtsA [Bacteroidales bacterium]|nr:cell division protein FtsA [Bacteroidales bacterium]MBQ5540330.1 cell division protein FtsA [Bacteroidales bacterium]MEE3447053.1 cell division protein FtsA [Bacteroidales bacterium]